MTLRTGLKLGALGGPNTFGGQAAQRMRQLYPEFTELVYFPTSEAGLRGTGTLADAVCVPEQMVNTGFHPGTQARVAVPNSLAYVIAEVTHEYHCSLLTKPGTNLRDIRKVLGHTGSVSQSRAWLQEQLPWAEIAIVESHSQAAAQEVQRSDGTIASVGTPEMAHQFGLLELAKEIDDGSVGHYWALSARPLFSESPTRLVVAGRFGETDQLGDTVCLLAEAGYKLATVFAGASRRKLFEYDYAMRFAGSGNLPAVKSALKKVTSARLAGAFEARE